MSQLGSARADAHSLPLRFLQGCACQLPLPSLPSPSAPFQPGLGWMTPSLEMEELTSALQPLISPCRGPPSGHGNEAPSHLRWSWGFTQWTALSKRIFLSSPVPLPKPWGPTESETHRASVTRPATLPGPLPPRLLAEYPRWHYTPPTASLAGVPGPEHPSVRPQACHTFLFQQSDLET